MRLLNFFITTIFFALTFSFGCSTISVSESTEPKDAIKSAFAKLSSAEFFHVITKTDMGGVLGETEVNYSAPDKYWIKNQSQAKSEIIAIGGETYQKAGDGKWTKLPQEKSFKISVFRDLLLSQANLPISEIESLGSKDLNGKKTINYKFRSGEDAGSLMTIWIFADTSLPGKLITEIVGDRPVVFISTYDFEKETPIVAPGLN